MGTEQVISMKQVCKSYQIGAEKLNVFKNIDFTVNKGEFTAIPGPSGSGKSTLMNIIGCMDSGSYQLNSIPIHEAKEKELTKIRNQEIGFIFQNYHLIPTYTVKTGIIPSCCMCTAVPAIQPVLLTGLRFADSQRIIPLSTGISVIAD